MARNLPSPVFTRPDVYGAEIQRLFAGQWICIGHMDQFKPGTVQQRTVGQYSILLSRSESDELYAFHNICRHRGTVLQSEHVRACSLIRCPYHGWSYGLNGELRGAPGMQGVAEFDKATQGLLPVLSATWQGLVFISINGCRDGSDEGSGDGSGKRVAELAAQWTDLPSLGADLTDLQVVESHCYSVKANWKLLGQNYNECYHCPAGHPQLHRVTRLADGGAERAMGRRFTGGPMVLRDGINTMSASGQTHRQALPGWPAGDLNKVHYYHLFPNLFLSMVPDYVLLHVLLPQAVDQTWVETLWLFSPREAGLPTFDPSDAVAFWDETNHQDWALCESAQQGHAGGQHRDGFYHPSEQCVHDFDRWYARWLTGAMA